MSLLPQSRFNQAPLFVLACATATGILLGHQPFFQRSPILIFSMTVSVCFLILSLYALRTARLGIASLTICGAFLFAGMTVSEVEQRSVAADRISRIYAEGSIAPEDPVEITGTIFGQPEAAPDGFYVKLKVKRIAFKGIDRAAAGVVLLLARTETSDIRQEYAALQLRHGACLRVITILNIEDSFRNPGAASFTEYLERKGYDATAVIKSPLLIERLDDDTVFLPLAWLYEWRERLEKEFDTKFSAETAGVLDAALLGNRHKVLPDVAERLRAGGTFHVLVIAGLHIGFVSGLVFLFVRRVLKHRLLQFALATTVIWAYAIAVGADLPVARATVMFTLIIFGPLVWRRANSLNVIGAAALSFLTIRPGDLFDPSFQLTFVSVLSIVLMAVPLLEKMRRIGAWHPSVETPYPPVCSPWFLRLAEALFWEDKKWRAELSRSHVSYRLFKVPIAARLEHWRLQRLARYTVSAVVVSLSVQVGLLPLLVIYFHRVSFASLVLNIVVGALMVCLGFLALAAIIISQINSVIASFLILIAEKISWTMTHLVDPFTRFGVASIRLPNYSGFAALVYAGYFVPLAFLIVVMIRWNPLRPALILEEPATGPSPKTVKTLAISFVALVALIVFHPLSAARADGKLEIDFLDVGQGDCALLTTPDGTTLLIDGGGKPNLSHATADGDLDAEFEPDARSIGERVVSEYLWTRGLDRIDYLLPTHADADHIDGLNDVARNFGVRGAIVARSPSNDPEYMRFAGSMKIMGIPIEKVGAGDVLRLGAVNVDVLWPPPNADVSAPWQNNDGLVLRVRFGDHRFLFTADIEREAETEILSRNPSLENNIIKVAHHGSRTSSTQPFVSAVKPSMAVISVGRTSPFGHPHEEVIARWLSAGARVLTTGKYGTISLISDGRTIAVSTFAR